MWRSAWPGPSLSRPKLRMWHTGLSAGTVPAETLSFPLPGRSGKAVWGSPHFFRPGRCCSPEVRSWGWNPSASASSLASVLFASFSFHHWLSSFWNFLAVGLLSRLVWGTAFYENPLCSGCSGISGLTNVDLNTLLSACTSVHEGIDFEFQHQDRGRRGRRRTPWAALHHHAILPSVSSL